MQSLRSAINSVTRSSRAFSSTPSRKLDVARVTLIGRLGRDPELRVTKSDKEYVTYTVATQNYPPPPAGADGTRQDPTTSWHRILSFNPGVNNYLRTLSKGSLVYVEANLEVKEPNATAEAGTPESQRQIFMRHETIRLLQRPRDAKAQESSE